MQQNMLQQSQFQKKSIPKNASATWRRESDKLLTDMQPQLISHLKKVSFNYSL